MKTVTIPASLMEWIKVRLEDGVIGSKDLLKAIADIEQVQDKMTVEKQPCEGFLPGNFNKTACVECGRSEGEHEKQPVTESEVHTSCEGCIVRMMPAAEGPCVGCYGTPNHPNWHTVPKQPAVEPGAGYRILGENEIIQEGDEFQLFGGDWISTANPNVKAGQVSKTYRRKIEQPAPEEAGCDKCVTQNCLSRGSISSVMVEQCCRFTPKQPAEARYSVDEVSEIVTCWLKKMHDVGLSPYLNVDHSHFGIKTFITERAGK